MEEQKGLTEAARTGLLRLCMYMRMVLEESGDTLSDDKYAPLCSCIAKLCAKSSDFSEDELMVLQVIIGIKDVLDAAIKVEGI